MALARVAPVALAAGRAAALSTSSPVARRPIAVAACRVDPSANLVALVSRSSSPAVNFRHAAVATDAAPTAPPAADTLTYVDTHCHLDLIFQKMTSEAKKGKKGDAAVVDFDSWRNQLTQLEDPDSESYLGAQLEACLTVACSRRAMDAVRDILPKPGVFAAFGCHPLSAHEWNADMASIVESAVADKNGVVVAVGECGLDYHYALKEIEADESLADDAAREARWEEVRKTQEDVFVAQMKIATRLGAPLVIHTREAEADTLRLMREHLRKDARVHVHCFTSSASMARTLLGEYPNLCLGFTGVCTFKNGGDVRDVVLDTPLDRILLETDGPYMAPAPHRGAVAHPGHVPHIAKKIAEVKGVRAEEVFAQCRANTRRTYGF